MTTITTPAASDGKFRSDWATLGPWYAAEILNSFSVLLAVNGTYFYARYHLHVSAATLLWLPVCGGVPYVLAALLAGRIADRIGQRKLIQMMQVLNIPVFVLGAWAVYRQSLGLLFLLIILLNITSTMIWPAVESAITRSPGRMKLSSRLTVYNFVWACGNFTAMCIGGSIADWLSWPMVFVLAGAASLTGWLVVVFLAVKQTEIGAHHAADSSLAETPPGLADSVRGKTLLKMAWLSNLLAYVCVNTVLPLMPRVTSGLHISSYAAATAIGSVWAFVRIGGFVLAWFWKGWHYKVRWMLFSFAGLAAATILIITASSVPEMVIAQALLGVATAMLYSGSLYYAMHLSHGSNENAGKHEAIIGVGTVVGPAVAALSGSPNALAPKALAIGVLLVVGGLFLGRWGYVAKGNRS